MAATYVLGYRLALLVAGAGALFMADQMDWKFVYFIMASLMLVGILTCFIIRDPEVDTKNNTLEQEASVISFILSLYGLLSNSVPIYQKGNDQVENFNDTLVVIVTLTAGQGLVTITEVPPLVGQLRDIQGTLQISFGSEA